EELFARASQERVEEEVLVVDPYADVLRRQVVVRMHGEHPEARALQEIPHLTPGEPVLDEPEPHERPPAPPRHPALEPVHQHAPEEVVEGHAEDEEPAGLQDATRLAQ